MTILEEMINLKADGVVFHSIYSNPSDVNCEIYEEHTLEEFFKIGCYPKSGRTYYRIKNGNRVYL